MKSVSWFLLCMAPFAVGGLTACSDDHGHGDHDADGDHDHDHGPDEDAELPPSCEAFHEQCLLAEGAEAEHCHELTHQSGVTEAECAEHKDECLAACTTTPGADAGTGSDAATTPGTGAAGAHCEQDSDCASGDCHDDHCH